jgi:ribosomal protein S18 acetylase RimI-like enzyme
MYVSQINTQDILEVARIGKSTLPISYSSYHLLELLGDTSYVILKLVDNNISANKIVGFVVLKEYSKNEETIQNSELEFNYSNTHIHIHIMSIAIVSEYQGKKYGTYLMKYIKHNFPRPNYSLYVQTTNKNALNFYIKHGFKIKKYVKNYYTNLKDKDAYYCATI